MKKLEMMSPYEVKQHFQLDEAGLSSARVTENREKYGENKLSKEKRFAGGAAMLFSVLVFEHLHSFFEIARLSSEQYGFIVLLSVLPLIAVQFGKRIVARLRAVSKSKAREKSSGYW